MTLEAALATAIEDVRAVQRMGGSCHPEAVLRLLGSIAAAAEPYTRWLSEADAMLRSGRRVEYLRSRFARWEAQGLAEKRGGRRYYRAHVIPQREHRAA